MINSHIHIGGPDVSADQDAATGVTRPLSRSDMRIDRVPESAESDRRIPELDALRGLACLVILLYHLMPHRVPGGWAMVDLFFVLSGYLITTIILRSMHEHRFLAHFIMRRGLRIWPVYFVTVLGVALLAPFLPRPYDLGGLPYLLTYTQNIPLYWSNAHPGFSPYLAHTWSLAIEEQFYIVWPILISLVGRRGVIPLSIAFAIVSVTARACGFHWWLLLARGDGLALGSLLAGILNDPRAATIRRSGHDRRVFAAVAIAAAAYLIGLACLSGIPPIEMPAWPGLSVLAIALLAFGIVGLVVTLKGHGATALLRRKWLVKIGTVSYGLYMYHYVIILLSDDLAAAAGLGGRPVWRQALTVAAIFAAAALSWRWLERPILRLKDHFRYGTSSPSRDNTPHFPASRERNGALDRPG